MYEHVYVYEHEHVHDAVVEARVRRAPRVARVLEASPSYGSMLAR